jgi:cyanophycin synthetase
VAVLRRDPACVFGDGLHNISELVDIENNNPLRDEKLFHKMIIDNEALKELTYQNLQLTSIPSKNQRINLGTKTSRGSGGAIVDVTAEVHPDNNLLFNKIGEYLDDPLIGIDFIIEDIKKSWQETPRCGVIECNSLPFIDLHHYPLQGQPINVAGKVWDFVYPI